jgi:putative endonuclease
MKELGRFYEKKAIIYLMKNNYTIIDINIHINHREIDILCIKNNITIIVEVKYRKKQYNWNFFPHINAKQKKNLLESGEILYTIQKYYWLPKLWRIDFIYFFIDDFKHFYNIFV